MYLKKCNIYLMIIDDLTLTESLAKTSFGEIFLTSKKGSSTQYVTNVIEKTSIKGKDAEKYIEREISILKEVNHPNILKLIEVKDKPLDLFAFKISNKVFCISSFTIHK